MTGPTVNLAEAARHSPRSIATLRRWLAAGTIAGAERDASGAWSIPVAALVEAGAWPSTTPPADKAPEVATSDALAAALALLAAAGQQVRTLDASELAKAEGALTCCSLLFEVPARSIPAGWETGEPRDRRLP